MSTPTQVFDVIVNGMITLNGQVILPDTSDLLVRLETAETKADQLETRLAALEARLSPL